ncbi:uncharacterized protein PFLUO_LOCUS9551 [Penicillium psychrofluorescens]|uniref:uncharacterized protein n=1 Tax=Penicillium psychrofluorescens TaxID=3158075 RepID=UPI003CCDB40E
MGAITRLSALTALLPLVSCWLPQTNKQITSNSGTNLFSSSNGKIRGVNLGSQFIFEPWLGESAWSDMGCGSTGCEFDCVKSLGQEAANKAFQKHWGSWITQDDITEMVSYGINTIRVPVGYWMREDLVNRNSEYFPQGGLPYLKNLCGWASDAGLYIIMDLHGAPGAQVSENAFTGQLVETPGFYNTYNYQRALRFLEWMTKLIHSTNQFRNVGMLEIVNEPVSDSDEATSMRKNYYPSAVNRIRGAEGNLTMSKNDHLHIQMMDELWGSGDPDQYLTNLHFLAYDDHRYLKWDTSVPASHSSYLNTSCSDERNSNWPTIVGEWSLAVPDNVQSSPNWDPSSNKKFYAKWFAAQVHAYEKQQGWVFWAWKSQLNDYRWTYQDAVKAGVIPKDLNSLKSPCS